MNRNDKLPYCTNISALLYAKQRVSATSKSLLSTGFSKTMGQLAEDELIYLTDQVYMLPRHLG